MKTEMDKLIEWYLDNWYPKTISALNGFKTVYDCAYAHYHKIYPNGREKYICDDHQCRVGNRNLDEFAKLIDANQGKLKSANNFEGLYDIINNYDERFGVERIKRIGVLAKYDCAARISWLDEYNHLRPENLVYIHAGVYKGAMLLYERGYIRKPTKNDTLPITEFKDKTFKKLFEYATGKMSKSMIIESFLCDITKYDAPTQKLKKV